jgi:hypothetical protein
MLSKSLGFRDAHLLLPYLRDPHPFPKARRKQLCMQEQRDVFPPPAPSAHLDPLNNETLIKVESQVAFIRQLVTESRLFVEQVERVIAENRVLIRKLRAKARLPQ